MKSIDTHIYTTHKQITLIKSTIYLTLYAKTH